jgi:hypothetical protein
MNAVSYINGDTVITDFPACSARPLAAFVQWCNDVLAGPDGYLSPEDSLLALDLAWLTVGTAEVPYTVIHAWVAELLTNPTWGVIHYAEGDAAHAAASQPATWHRLPRGLAPTARRTPSRATYTGQSTRPGSTPSGPHTNRRPR